MKIYQMRVILSFLTSLLCMFFFRESRIAGKAIPDSMEIKVITYNVCGLPDVITKDRGLDPAAKRFPVIGKKLSDYDIIGLQEVFVPERYLLEKRLRRHFLARGSDSGILSSPGSGIYIFSRWELPKSIYEKWQDMKSYDALSLKGFVAATVRTETGPEIDVYNFHAQAGGYPELRRKNYEQMLNVMKQFSFETGRPVIVMGDFNCEIMDKECEWIIRNAALTHVNPTPEGIDHIFFNENGSAWKISVLSFGVAFDKPFKGKMLSDHNAFEAVLKFERR